ncbi:hypothetical protein DNTS_027599 [Danionella cerebrum]|uniref:Uncharacterized protein n=1 Tax=Danionella cerebrum TaxID=2873325 RepID=A0A553QW67_9TELE|nr:hypothetical protein DNTS_027599 [Danionella translucida]
MRLLGFINSRGFTEREMEKERGSTGGMNRGAEGSAAGLREQGEGERDRGGQLLSFYHCANTRLIASNGIKQRWCVCESALPWPAAGRQGSPRSLSSTHALLMGRERRELLKDALPKTHDHLLGQNKHLFEFFLTQVKMKDLSVMTRFGLHPAAIQTNKQCYSNILSGSKESRLDKEAYVI